MKPIPFITLLTDFGLEDPFVGIMKGVILSINPVVRIIDICHEIDPHDIVQAAYQWKAAYAYSPPGTVQVGVVDPGVGGERKGILAVSEHYFYIAPDNGMLTLVEREDPFCAVYELQNPGLRLAHVSSTFHGRDIFAPVAGHLSLGVPPEDFGPGVDQIKRLDLPQAVLAEENILQGRVVGVDRFGNILTNVEAKQFKKNLGPEGFELNIKDKCITRFQKYYAETQDTEPFVLINSMGHLEIALANSRVDRHLGAGAGDSFTIRFFH